MSKKLDPDIQRSREFAAFVGIVVAVFVALILYEMAVAAIVRWVCACEPADGVIFAVTVVPILFLVGILISSMLGEP